MDKEAHWCALSWTCTTRDYIQDCVTRGCSRREWMLLTCAWGLIYFSAIWRVLIKSTLGSPIMKTPGACHSAMSFMGGFLAWRILLLLYLLTLPLMIIVSIIIHFILLSCNIKATFTTHFYLTGNVLRTLAIVARFSQSYKCSSNNVNKIVSNVLNKLAQKRYLYIIHGMFLPEMLSWIFS